MQMVLYIYLYLYLYLDDGLIEQDMETVTLMVVDDNINRELSKRKPVYTGILKLGHMEPYSLQQKEHM